MVVGAENNRQWLHTPGQLDTAQQQTGCFGSLSPISSVTFISPLLAQPLQWEKWK